MNISKPNNRKIFYMMVVCDTISFWQLIRENTIEQCKYTTCITPTAWTCLFNFSCVYFVVVFVSVLFLVWLFSTVVGFDVLTYVNRPPSFCCVLTSDGMFLCTHSWICLPKRGKILMHCCFMPWRHCFSALLLFLSIVQKEKRIKWRFVNPYQQDTLATTNLNCVYTTCYSLSKIHYSIWCWMGSIFDFDRYGYRMWPNYLAIDNVHIWRVYKI